MTWNGGAVLRWARWSLLVLVTVWGVATAIGTDAPLLTSVLVLALVGALLLSPRFPIAALAAVLAGMFAWGSLVDSGQGDDPFIAMLVIASYGVGRHAGMTRQPWAAAAVLLMMATNATEPGRDVVVADVVFPALLTAGPWLLGLVVQLALRRERAAVDHARQVDATREEEVRRAAAEERLRIARELHDEVAHSISALSLQAQVLRRGVAAGGSVGEADLRGIETTAQQAMSDLRRLLGLLRPSGPDDPGSGAPLEPQRGLDDVPRLLQEVRAAGQRVRFREEGRPRAVTPVLGAAAYRILQEGLTNARRHGTGETDVVLRHLPDAVEVEVANDIGPGATVRSGHGTTGMRERAALFGGELVCAPDGDRWLLRATLPAPAREAVG